MAEAEGLEPSCAINAAVFKTGELPIAHRFHRRKVQESNLHETVKPRRFSKPLPYHSAQLSTGGLDGTRTHDLLIDNQMP